jgi:hypothetical protein
MVNGKIPAKRGVYSAFRQHLNEQFAGWPKHRNKGDVLYEQRTRGYGDYLYFQDRAKFDVELCRALEGLDFPGFDRRRWLAAAGGGKIQRGRRP